MSTLRKIVPILLVALPMTMATINNDSEYPQSSYSNTARDSSSDPNSNFMIRVTISIICFTVSIICCITAFILIRRRNLRNMQYESHGNTWVSRDRQRRMQRAGRTAPAYRPGEDVYLPSYSYQPMGGETVVATPAPAYSKDAGRGETVVAGQTSGVVQPVQAHVSKDVV